MRDVKRAKKFINGFNKVRMSDSQYSKYVRYIALLIEGEVPPAEAEDHPLKGHWQGHREFHVGGDLLVIYRIIEDQNMLELARIGTHAQLFE